MAPRPAGAQRPLVAALTRLGGILVSPRATIAGLGAGDAGESVAGARDGVWLTLVYAVTSQSGRLAEGVAALAAMGNVNGGLVLAQAVGRAFLPPVVLLFLVESALGQDRAYRRGLFLVPLVFMGALGRLSSWVGVPWPGPSFVPDLLGTLWAAGLAFGLRQHVEPEPSEGAEGSSATPPADEPAGPGRLALVAGAVLAGVCVTSAATDVRAVVVEWSTMGPLGPGQSVPEFSAHRLAGGTFDRDDLQASGEVTMLAFWATWCGACAQQMPSLVELDQRYDGRGLALYGVNIDRDGDQAQLAAQYAQARGLSFPILLDTGRIADAFRVTLIPHVVLFDRDGGLRYVHQGKVGAGTLEHEIETLLAE